MTNEEYIKSLPRKQLAIRLIRIVTEPDYDYDWEENIFVRGTLTYYYTSDGSRYCEDFDSALEHQCWWLAQQRNDEGGIVMGTYSSFSVRGWHVDGNNRITSCLSASEKEYLQDLIFDHGADEDSSSHSPDDDMIIEFGSTSFHAFDYLQVDLSAFTVNHKDIVIECECYFEDGDIHELWRFKDNISERVPREEFYPPFTILTIYRPTTRTEDKK